MNKNLRNVAVQNEQKRYYILPFQNPKKTITIISVFFFRKLLFLALHFLIMTYLELFQAQKNIIVSDIKCSRIALQNVMARNLHALAKNQLQSSRSPFSIFRHPFNSPYQFL